MSKSSRRFWTAAVGLAMIVGLACAPPAAQDSSEIRAQAKAWENAFNDGDSEGVAALYAEDARLMPPNGEIEQGRDEVRAAFGAMIDSGVKITLDTTEAVAVGDLGHRIGTYTISADGVEVDRGKYAETWLKGNEGWRITNDIWNSDISLAEPPASTISVTHEVKDVDKWLAAWSGEDSRAKLFAEHGVSGVRVFRSVDEGSKLVGLVVDITDQEAFEALLASDEGVAAKKADGVIDKSMQMLVEVR